MKYTKTKITIIISIFIAFLLLSVGYASLSTDLLIDGSASVDPSRSMLYFENLVGPQLGGSATVSNASLPTLITATMSGTLSNKSDYIIYNIDLVNTNASNSAISALSIESNSLYNDLKVDLVYTDSEIPVAIGDVFNAGARRQVTVKIYFNNDTVTKENVTVKITLGYSETAQKAVYNCTATNLNENSILTCGTETFYIFNNNGTRIYAIAMYPLNVNQTLQSSSTSSKIAFSANNYWYSGNSTTNFSDLGYQKGIDGKGTYYYVYDQNSSLYPYLQSYLISMKTTMGVKKDAVMRLPSSEEISDMKSNNSTIFNAMISSMSSVGSTYTWTGSASSNTQMRVLRQILGWNLLSNLTAQSYTVTTSDIRPVIEMDIANIKIG